MASLTRYITPTLLIPILVLAAILCFFGYYWFAVSPREGTLEWVSMHMGKPKRISFKLRRHPMGKKDALPLLLVTAVYAVTAFWSLGSFTAPQSFCSFQDAASVTFSLKAPLAVGRIVYYTGLGTGDYTLEASPDGTRWYTLQGWKDTDSGNTSFYWEDEAGIPSVPLDAETGERVKLPHQAHSELFRWIDTPALPAVDGDGGVQAPLSMRMFRLTASNPQAMELGELAFYDEHGGRISNREVAFADEQAAKLFDEFDTVPAQSTWYNSTHFDEIYHARTAYEHIQGVYPYEVSHPPLGKLILGLGIRLFGMTPFGWRFMGTLFGVGMLPLLYVFLKNLFGKTALAFCGTALFAFDFMHLTQTRIATIDTYGVFFILAMYYFMYRYLTVPPGASFKKGALPLFLSGLMWGLGAASKWTVIYGAAGLAVLYFAGLYFKWRDWPRDGKAPAFGPWLVKTLLCSVLCFILIPAVIYTASYLPYAAAKGDASLGSLVKTMWDNQVYMLTYHQGVMDAHPYSSRWYQWIVDGRPILYYMDNATAGYTARIAAFSNPVVCWGGLLAIIATAVQMFRRKSGKALFIVVGYLSQLAPWMLIGRTTFEYHYFPSILFLVLALAFVMNDIIERGQRGWKWAVYGMTGGAAALYAAFYPVLIGLKIPTWYATGFLQWLPSWPL